MEKTLSKQIVKTTLQNSFDKERFVHLVRNLLKGLDESKAFHAHGYVKEQFKQLSGTIKTYERIGTYTDPEDKKLDILIVYLEKKNSIDHARTTLRNFVADYLKQRGQKDAALVAFVSPNLDDWRFSLVKMDYRFEEGANGKMKVREEFTPARRWSFLVGMNENSHTAQSRLAPLVEHENSLSLTQLEESFNIEKVTQEFFEKYREVFLRLMENLDELLKRDSKVRQDFAEKDIDSVDFAKKLLGQIVFLYFLQKKGWFGVGRDESWGTGPKDFIRRLFERMLCDYDNFFNDVLEPLFYQALANGERSDNYYERFDCKVPFLNGGLFDPIGNYDWVHTDIILDDEIFSNSRKTKEGDIGDGILDIFDRYNFTVREDEPLEKEVAVDPEMLGKVFENLLEVKDRKSKGTYYTPREIVHYMCEQSLINYLATELEGQVDKEDIEVFIKIGNQVIEKESLSLEKEKEDFTIPKLVRKNAQVIDQKLADIKVCDPAIGSGAFPVGMMNEIVTARLSLNPYLCEISPGSIECVGRTAYDFKLQAITNSIYGVDIDPGAVEIAKLRLWLSLIVDENDIKKIHPLPNLDYKIMQGNSLLEEFEGIKLFDEKIIPEEAAGNEEQVKAANGKISEIHLKLKELLAFGKLSKAELEILNNQARDQQKIISSLTKKLEVKTNQLDFDNQKDETREKWDELTSLHKKIVSEYHKKEKETMLKRASELEWEFIEATLRNEGRIDSIKQIEQFKKKNTKPFFLWHLHFADVFQKKGGFDAVIANPPYVEHKKLKPFSESFRKSFSTYSGTADLYVYFYERGIELARNGGVLTYITSNKFFKTSYGLKLRGYLCGKSIDKIIDFGKLHIFDALVASCILIVENHPPKEPVKIATINDELKNYQNLADFIDKNSASFDISDLGENIWQLENKERLAIKSKIDSLAERFSDINTIKICRGVTTGYNPAFVIDSTVKNQLLSQNSRNGEIIQPLIQGRDIRKWQYKPSSNFIINTGFSTEVPKEYPAIYRHLINYKKDLEIRADQGKNWWNLRACKYYPEFKKEKIVWGLTADKWAFAYDNDKNFLPSNGYILTSEKIPIKYILALLNSNLLRFYFVFIGIMTAGGAYTLKHETVRELPIVVGSEEDQEHIIKFVDNILAIARSGDYISNPAKQAEVHEFENQIDQMIYKLYDLTPDEIKIVEGQHG